MTMNNGNDIDDKKITMVKSYNDDDDDRSQLNDLSTLTNSSSHHFTSLGYRCLPLLVHLLLADWLAHLR
jgi:hypothetical protein